MVDLDMLDHDSYIDRAYELAQRANERGDDPYGALLVRGGEVRMEAKNAVRTTNDLVLHPELTLARRVSKEFAPETVLYTSTEPCTMCAAGICYARLAAVVYGVSAEKAAMISDYERGIPCAEVVSRYNADTEVIGPVSPDAGERLLRGSK